MDETEQGFHEFHSAIRTIVIDALTDKYVVEMNTYIQNLKLFHSAVSLCHPYNNS